MRHTDHIIQNGELYHYGVKGMKWGVRRYQNKNASLTKAGKERAKKTQSDTDKKSERDHSKSNKTPLALFLMRAGVNITTSNPAGMAYDLATLAQTGKSYVKAQIYKNERKELKVDKKTGFYRKKAEMTVYQDAARVNPLVHNFDKNTKNNCMLCTATYDLRRRGYEVTAKKASYGYMPEDIKAWYPKAKLRTVTGLNDKSKPSTKATTEKLVKTLTNQGEGARGNLVVKWKGVAGGHSVAYEVNNGQLNIIDAQTNRVYKKPESFLRRCKPTITYARLDNVDFDMKTIKEVAE